ncbi:MAG: sugar transferase [Paludibacteraceae bacterium]|nr:sugar transferase [Paludibacteraceae bacterium]
MKKRSILYKYVVCDAVMALLAWAILNGIRTMAALRTDEFSYLFLLPEYNAKIVYPLIPFFWFFLHWMSGYYNDVWFKSRVSELVTTILTTIIGSTILFFLIIVDDAVSDYSVYLQSYFTLIGLQFTFTYTARLAITVKSAERINKGEIGFNTLILGVGEKAAKLYKDLLSTPKSTGYIVKGFVNMESSTEIKVPHNKVLGTGKELLEIIGEFSVSQVIIAVENITDKKIYSIIGTVGQTGVGIKFIPSKYHLVTGSVKLDTIYGIPMIDLSAIKMNDWEVNFKRFFDIALSVLAIILLSPLYVFFFIAVGKKPIYSQERVGQHGRIFSIYKFRSMILNAETDTPMLSSNDDPRITRLGRFMRKYRLDELPQFFNVINGDMSLVGPRPERQYYVEQIVKLAPYYYMLQNVKPGITSWGMVKFGYANTVEQMVERASYDMLYLENASLLLDLKIMIYTVKTICTGKGM